MNNENILAEEYRKVVANCAKMASGFIDGDKIDEYQQNGADESYAESLRMLERIQMTYGLAYLYVIRPDSDQNNADLIFGVDSEGATEPGGTSGELPAYEFALAAYMGEEIEGEPIVVSSNHGLVVTAFAPVRSKSGSITALVGADIAADQIVFAALSQTGQVMATIAIFITVALVIIMLIIYRQILRPILKLSNHLQHVVSGDNLHEFEIMRTGNELQTMFENFNSMVGDMRLYIEKLAITSAERERIATELDVAKTIQSGMLPSIFPPFPDRKELDIHALMIPAKEVGGDCYDFFLVSENSLAVVIADVSGKGVPAALFMVIVKTLIKNAASAGMSPKEAFESVNNTLCESNEAMMFVTAFMGLLDLDSGQFKYVNAGHNSPLIMNAGGSFSYLKSKPSFVLAGFEDMKYTNETTELLPGDVLLMYTDGVTEAMSESGELYSEERLLSAANSHKDCSCAELVVAIKRELDIFAGQAEQADDITILALRIRTAGENSAGA
ncbi:MAG: PP2C family protein-serine/threonine phosphatase [Clostridiales bacterium]|nr:PP2C family protein-serine/threonine phosphatase [Clostridiales bacterium]